MSQRSLRILHVSTFGFVARGSSLHGVGSKLSNGLARAGHYVYSFDARQIARWATLFNSRTFGARRANRVLLDFAAHFAPELLVLGHAESVRMGLNLSRRSDHYLYSSNRMAHLMGNGILTFIDRGTGFGDLFGEDEIVFYASEDDLIDRIRLFHGNDEARRRVAERGWRRYTPSSTPYASRGISSIASQAESTRPPSHGREQHPGRC